MGGPELSWKGPRVSQHFFFATKKPTNGNSRKKMISSQCIYIYISISYIISFFWKLGDFSSDRHVSELWGVDVLCGGLDG